MTPKPHEGKTMRPSVRLVAALLLGGVCFLAGLLASRYVPELLGVVRALKNSVVGESVEGGPWSIGIYHGDTPFDLTAPSEVHNPVLTWRDVTDVQARFVADPFLVIRDGQYTMFLEVLNRQTNQGDIAYAVSADGLQWQYQNVVLDESFHLSYPYVFEWNGDFYMIPESFEDLSVRLYRAMRFPDQWQFQARLLSGFRFVDPSIVRFAGKWWLFVATTDNDTLNLYYSENLERGWAPHPANPIVRFDKNVARPGGRVIVNDGHVYRFAQDDDPSYGTGVFAFEIVELTETTYRERLVKQSPIVGATGQGWNAAGMHQVDVQHLGGKWIAAVDGRSE